MMRMHPSSLQLEQDQDHVSSTTKESMATNIATHEVEDEEEEAVIVTAAAAAMVDTFNVNVVEEEDHCYSDEEESLQVSEGELLMDNFSSALVSSILTMDSGYIEYVNDNKDNEDEDDEDNEDNDNEDNESELNKFEYYDCSTRNQDDQHILIRGYKLIDNMCCSIGSGAIVVPVEKEKEEEKEEAHSVVVDVTEVTLIASELNEVLLVPPPPTLVESTTFNGIATPLVEDADIAAAAAAVALNDVGDNDNNGAWFEQFSAGYEDLCCCVGTTNITNTNTSSATSITKNTSENYVNNNGNDTIKNTNNINNHECLVLYTQEDTPTKLTVIDNAVEQQLHKQQSMLSIDDDDDDDDDDDNYYDNTNGESVVVVPEPVAEVAEVLSDVQQGIVCSNMQLKKQPNSKEVDDKEKEEQVKEDNEGSELILDDPRYNCNTNVPVSSESSASSSCGAQMKKSFRSTKTPLNSSKTKNSNMNSKNDDDNDDHGDYIEQQTVCTNRDTVVTNATNKSTKSIMTTTTNKKSSSTVTKVEKLKEHLRDMVRVRARAFPFKKTFSSSSFGSKSNNSNSTYVPSALAPAPELLSPTPKKNNKQMKIKDKNAVMLSTSSTKKVTNCSASSKSSGRRKTSNTVNKRRPVLLSVTIEEEGHTTENIIVAPLFTKAAANENENDDDEESKDVLSAIPKLIVPKKRQNKHYDVTDDKTSVSVLSRITESNKSIHTILRKELNNDDQRDDADTSLFPGCDEFIDAIRLRYQRVPHNLPAKCDGCGSAFDVGHALQCKSGGLIIRRHDELNLELASLAKMALKESAIRAEPEINPSASIMDSSNTITAIDTNGDRGDLLIKGFWDNGMDAIIDVRITDTDAKSYRTRDPKKVLQSQEKEKKKKYLDQCLLQRRAFTPFVVSVDGLIGYEASNVLKQLSKRLADKWNKPYSVTCGIVRSRISIACARASNQCLRGSRIPFKTMSRQIQWEDGAGAGLYRIVR